MSYFPLSQIKTNLYTYGDEYTTLDGQPYKGYYYKVSTGKLFTGKTPQDLPNLELVISNINTPIEAEINNNLSTPAFYTSDPDPEVIEEYRESVDIYGEYTLVKGESKVLLSPSYISPTPTLEDYQNGEFRRYFCKKGNEILYLEINKTQYDLLITKSPTILYSLYEPFNLPWKLTGTKEEVEKTNRNIVALTSKRLQLPQFGKYLKDDYLKYYK
jgi:hypothetical protein